MARSVIETFALLWALGLLLAFIAYPLRKKTSYYGQRVRCLEAVDKSAASLSSLTYLRRQPEYEEARRYKDSGHQWLVVRITSARQRYNVFRTLSRAAPFLTALAFLLPFGEVFASADRSMSIQLALLQGSAVLVYALATVAPSWFSETTVYNLVYRGSQQIQYEWEMAAITLFPTLLLFFLVFAPVTHFLGITLIYAAFPLAAGYELVYLALAKKLSIHEALVTSSDLAGLWRRDRELWVEKIVSGGRAESQQSFPSVDMPQEKKRDERSRCGSTAIGSASQRKPVAKRLPGSKPEPSWSVPIATALVSTALAVVVNVATGGGGGFGAWAAILLLTAASAALQRKA